MGTKTHYEWSYQCIDTHGDIIEHDFVDALKDLPEDPCCRADECIRHELELWRGVWRDDGELMIREFGLVSDGKLPEQMDAGSRVPKKFHKELEKKCLHL